MLTCHLLPSCQQLRRRNKSDSVILPLLAQAPPISQTLSSRVCPIPLLTSASKHEAVHEQERQYPSGPGGITSCRRSLVPHSSLETIALSSATVNPACTAQVCVLPSRVLTCPRPPRASGAAALPRSFENAVTLRTERKIQRTWTQGTLSSMGASGCKGAGPASGAPASSPQLGACDISRRSWMSLWPQSKNTK